MLSKEQTPEVCDATGFHSSKKARFIIKICVINTCLINNINVMATSVYKINKGINKPIEFKGLKAQYIKYLGIGLVALFVLFAILYITGINMYICLGFTALGGTGLFIQVYKLSNKYGEYGMMKKAARRNVPHIVKVRSRKLFFKHDERKTK